MLLNRLTSLPASVLKQTARKQSKVAMVTGAASGIGRQISVDLAKRGVMVAMVDRDLEGLKETEKIMQSQCIKIRCDVMVDEERQSVVDTVVSELGRLDLLVNNAGNTLYGDIATATTQDFRSIFKLLVEAPFCFTKCASEQLKKTKGGIINISSTNSLLTRPTLVCYSMAKAALDKLTDISSTELAPSGVRVNSVHPSVVTGTNIHRRFGMTDDVIKKNYETMLDATPLRLLPHVTDISAAVLFLASEEARCITGQHLVVDGGLVKSDFLIAHQQYKDNS